MNILVANDDGIGAKGIMELARVLSQIANIYVCAPHTQRSACGHGITIGKPITMNEVEFPNAKRAWEISGTPADCVKLGLRMLSDQGIKINMVCSGINHGGNLGTDTLYSGTVSAAIEGCICGLPAIAVSVNSHKPKYFDVACDLALKTVKSSIEKIDSNTVLNINVPNVSAEEVKGVKITRLGAREYEEWFEPKEDEKGELAYWYSGTPVIYKDLPEDIDVIAMQDGYASITPLHYDLTSYKLIEEVKTWGIV
ncbi:5'/3'-nucleotidase SurE [Sinanaerobacter chloroacetimidivorans]|uniref:5'-nucleotidase SurE n=1 Tax=Sinanaerobacter chloroacetimidivorans TaxID=2818044 RepID=A0A8J7VZE7_9FIRM|nr:5'/3'-nucleotidase SurE [Sinanaerobacter chloroacetimidivorans]MBR0597957.1 5'/3'-nucleotidase SurE [Sinanaerobacter chloroacetimidivorans]